jgi:hypothetical protein
MSPEIGVDYPCYSGGEIEDYTVKFTNGAFNASADNAVAANNVKQTTLHSLMVSPNPVNTSFANLKLQTWEAGTVNIKIADLLGRILRSENIQGIIAGSNSYALHNLNLLPGTYVIIATQANSVIARTSFIIAK